MHESQTDALQWLILSIGYAYAAMAQNNPNAKIQTFCEIGRIFTEQHTNRHNMATHGAIAKKNGRKPSRLPQCYHIDVLLRTRRTECPQIRYPVWSYSSLPA